jgi:hypothetical protein
MATTETNTAMEPSVLPGDIFKGPSLGKVRRERIETNLNGQAFGHMLLVLGPLQDRPGIWRVMTVRVNFDGVNVQDN